MGEHREETDGCEQLSVPDSNQVSATNRPLRIAYFTFSFAPVLTGISLACHYRVRWFLDRGHTVLLLHPEIDEQYPVSVRERQMPGLESFADDARFASQTYPTKPHLLAATHPEPRSFRYWSDTRLLEEFQPDVVVVDEAAGMRGVSSVFFGGYGRPVGGEYRENTGCPTVALYETNFASYAERYLGRWVTRLLQPVVRRILQKFSAAYSTTLFPSQELLELNRPWGVQPATWLPFHGVDCEAFRPENVRLAPLPDDDRPTVLFIGRLVREKNVDYLIDAFEHVADQLHDAHLVIIGTGSEEERLKRRVQRFASHVTFWGESYGNELKGWYARANVFVNPSVTEVFSTTTLQAMASGTPVVATNAGGNREQVADGANGFLTDPATPVSLAQRLVEVLTNLELERELSEQARQSALK